MPVCSSVYQHDNARMLQCSVTKFEHKIVYKSSDEFDIGRCPTKVNVKHKLSRALTKH